VLTGVLSVILVIALGEGAQRSVEKNVEALGENIIAIRAKVPDTATGTTKDAAPRLTLADARAIARESKLVLAAAPVLEGVARVVVQSVNESAQALGVTREYFIARNYRVTEGVFWDEQQESLGVRVCLLGSALKKTLFKDDDAVGRYVRVGTHQFKVLGVLAEKGQAGSGMDQDNVVLLPLVAMRAKLVPGRQGDVSQIFVATHKGASNEGITKVATQVLRERHRIGIGQDDDFDIRDQAKTAESQRAIVLVMRVLMLCLAALTLIIGGIGVMNIMMVSVTERSREIGTRLSIGARASDVLAQFMIEAVILSLLGGFLGAACSFALLDPLGGAFGYVLEISESALAVGFGASLVLGLVFGYLPAKRAAGMDPVAALRSE
jgi:putative ABC transport system permease protein